MTPRRTLKVAASTAAGVLVLAACTTGIGDSTPPPRSGSGGNAQSLEPIEESNFEDVPSALKDIDNPDLPDPIVDVTRIISGGPPPDGIPPIDEPVFEKASSIEWLTADEPVLALEVNGETRAYPVQILIWHEIVNDTVQGEPVAITYCPLCNSALAFHRAVGDRLLTFGTSGSLYQSDLVMYDRQTESLWPQIEGTAVAGFLTGTELERIPVATVPWGQWAAQNPDAWVLSKETGFDRDYGRNPYQGYDEAASDPFLFDEEADPRLLPKERVVAVPGPDPVAVPLADLSKDRVLSTTVDGAPVVMWATGGLRSALDAGTIAKGKEIAVSGVFDPVYEGQMLAFVADNDKAFRDELTGSSWSVLGTATSGPLKGEQLARIPHIDTFWFAWAAFEPETRLLGGISE